MESKKKVSENELEWLAKKIRNEVLEKPKAYICSII
jgi:hypothetical protein